ncbi:MAG: hypothetical protein Q9187_006971, partial [Circinaria calcarea]
NRKERVAAKKERWREMTRRVRELAPIFFERPDDEALGARRKALVALLVGPEEAKDDKLIEFFLQIENQN